MSGSRTDKFRNVVAVFLLIVIAGGLFYILERQKKINVERAASPAQVESTETAETDGGATSEDADADENEEAEAKAPVVFCKPGDETKSLRISHERFLSLLNYGQVWVPVTAAESCYHEGKSAALTERVAEDGFVYELRSRGIVKVISIEERNLKDLQDETKYLLTVDELKRLRRGLKRRRVLTGEKRSSLKVKMLLLKPESWLETRKNYGAPAVHPAARTLNLDEFKAALARGEVPYDVRPFGFFKRSTIKGAANLPANLFDPNQFMIQPPSALDKLKFYIDINPVLHMKKKPLIVFSSCPADFLSYNAITYLRRKGFRKIRWFRGGLEHWKTDGKGCGTPETIAGIRAVDAEEVKRHLADRTLLLYVNGGFNLVKYEIKNSTGLVYGQKHQRDLMPAFRPVVWDEAKFKASGDTVDLAPLHLNPDTPAIVYGRNEYDWRPVKVALMLKAKGIKSVSWYRFGIEDWINHTLFRPADFPTKPDYVRK